MADEAAVSPAFQPQRGNPRFPLFESLRGIAILAIVMLHTLQWGNPRSSWIGLLLVQMNSGVQLFFAVSGFLLYRPFAAATAAGRPAPSAAGYARRRILRIVPAYWAALTVLSLWPGSPWVTGALTRDWWIYYFFVQVYSDRTRDGGIRPAWSLCVEAGFYLLLPAYALIARSAERRFGWRLGQLAPLGLLVAIGLAAHALCAKGHLPWLVRMTVAGQAHFFAVGMALAVLSVHVDEQRSKALERVRRTPGLFWFGSLAAFVLAATHFGLEMHAKHNAIKLMVNDTLIAVATGLLLAPAVFGDQGGGFPRWILRRRSLHGLGTISYGVFLWHLPLARWLESKMLVRWTLHAVNRRPHAVVVGWNARIELLLITLLASCLLAGLSYRLLELPLLRLKDDRRAKLTTAADDDASRAAN